MITRTCTIALAFFVTLVGCSESQRVRLLRSELESLKESNQQSLNEARTQLLAATAELAQQNRAVQGKVNQLAQVQSEIEKRILSSEDSIRKEQQSILKLVPPEKRKGYNFTKSHWIDEGPLIRNSRQLIAGNTINVLNLKDIQKRIEKIVLEGSENQP